MSNGVFRGVRFLFRGGLHAVATGKGFIGAIFSVNSAKKAAQLTYDKADQARIADKLEAMFQQLPKVYSQRAIFDYQSLILSEKRFRGNRGENIYTVAARLIRKLQEHGAPEIQFKLLRAAALQLIKASYESAI